MNAVRAITAPVRDSADGRDAKSAGAARMRYTTGEPPAWEVWP